MAELVYVYYGKNEYLIDIKIEEKIKELKIDEFNIVKYDLLENTSDDVIEDLVTVSFFSERKVIVVKNINHLLKASEAITKQWVNYLEKPNPDVTLFIVLDELIDEAFDLGKSISKYAYIEHIKELEKNDVPNYVKTMVDKYKYKISEEAVLELVNRTDSDLLLISQELEKLMLFKYDTKEIKSGDVKLLVSRNLEENIYELTNNLLSGNKTKAIEVYYDLMARNEDPLRVMNNISLKVRELIHTKLLIEKGYSQDEIQTHFNIKRGRAYYLVKNANEVSFMILEEYLKKLSTLDFEIKSGKVDKKLGLELFLLGA